MVVPIDILPVKTIKSKPLIKTKDGDCVLMMKGGGFTWKKVGTKEEVKKDQEVIYLESFLNTETGRYWFKKNDFIKYEEGEEPDFIFKTKSENIGLEITTLFIEGGIGQQINRTLQNIADRVFKYFKDKKGIKLGIDIEFINKEKFTKIRLKWKYMGLLELPMPEKDLEQKIIEEISKVAHPGLDLEKIWIPFETHWMKITVCNWGEPVMAPTGGHCERMYREDPLDKVQEEIDKKNKKLDKYKQNCSDCVLLIVADSSDTRTAPVQFSNKLKSHTFISNFKEVYLLETGDFKYRATKLKTNHIGV